MKIALIGYGKMGKMIEQIALSRGHEIVSIIDIDNLQDFESSAFASADVAHTTTTSRHGKLVLRLSAVLLHGSRIMATMCARLVQRKARPFSGHQTSA